MIARLALPVVWSLRRVARACDRAALALARWAGVDDLDRHVERVVRGGA